MDGAGEAEMPRGLRQQVGYRTVSGHRRGRTAGRALVAVAVVAAAAQGGAAAAQPPNGSAYVYGAAPPGGGTALGADSQQVLASETVGAEGGTVAAASGERALRLAIPEGTFREPVRITMARPARAATGGAGAVEPGGGAAPVRLAVDVTATDLDGRPLAEPYGGPLTLVIADPPGGAGAERALRMGRDGTWSDDAAAARADGAVSLEVGGATRVVLVANPTDLVPAGAAPVAGPEGWPVGGAGPGFPVPLAAAGLAAAAGLFLSARRSR